MARKQKKRSRKSRTGTYRPARRPDTDRLGIQQILIPALIVLLTLLAYIPAIQGGYIWDDDNYVTDNANLRSFDGLVRIWLEPITSPQYYPLVFSSFWAEYQLWGLHPMGYHLVNVLLHAANAILLWLILRRLQIPVAWLPAMVFALHPVCVESVAWITERKNVLSGLFYLGSALCLLKYYSVGSVAATLAEKRKWYITGLALFVCALLSKTVTASLPVAIVIVLWWKKGRISWQDLTALLPFFLIGLVFGLATVWLEKHHVGALGSEWDQTIVERLLIAGRALWFYAAKLLWPVNLMFNYPRWQIDSTALWQYMFPLGVVLLLLGGWILRHRIGRGPLAGILFFFLTLFPALGFFNVFPFRYSFVADHFQYLASIGVIVCVFGGAGHLAAGMSQRGKQSVAVAGAALLIPLFFLTWHQGYLYKDLRTLWTTTLKQNPSSALAHFNLGVMIAKEGNFEEGMVYLTEALRLVPDSAEIHKTVGIALAKQKRFGEAERHFSEAVRLRPDFAEAHYYLAILLAKRNSAQEAIDHLSNAVQLDPDYADAHFELGLLLGNQGLLERAAYHFAQTLRINPGHAAARKNLQLSRNLKENQPPGKPDE